MQPCVSGLRPTTAESASDAYVAMVRKACATGRHMLGCQHRPVAPFVLRAIVGALPAKELAR